MTPRIHFWTGWDFIGVLWLVIGLAALALIPGAVINYADGTPLFLVAVTCGGLLFVLAAFGRRGQHLVHMQQEHPRPFDAPD